jgi:hypothetical protein
MREGGREGVLTSSSVAEEEKKRSEIGDRKQ